jgi:hypothetical protein
MLTANLTKSCKSYYPAAEIEIVYEQGNNQVIQLIPPYNAVHDTVLLSRCFPGAAGRDQKKQTMDFDAPVLSVTDLVTDPTRKIREIVFRCVASETAVGLVAISLLSGK